MNDSKQQNLGPKLHCSRCGSLHPQLLRESDAFRHPHFGIGWYVQWTCSCGKTQCKRVEKA